MHQPGFRVVREVDVGEDELDRRLGPHQRQSLVDVRGRERLMPAVAQDRFRQHANLFFVLDHENDGHRNPSSTSNDTIADALIGSAGEACA